MKVSAIKALDGRDLRSSIHPETIKNLISNNIEVIFEEGIGKGIHIEDKIFEELGAAKVSRSDCLEQADFIMTTECLSDEDLDSIPSGKTVIGTVNPFENLEAIKKFANKKINLVSMEFVPRITRAQKMDVLSSQANLAGYVAVLEASNLLTSAMPMMMTAAGTLKPARVFVIGVGVAGLQAIATAKRLGARVEAFDTRDVVEEQVQSLGAKFVKIDLGETGETSQGYAKELTKEQLEKQKELQSKVCERSDIVITTAQLFGRPAPRIIDLNTISKMKKGSVILDMAVESGGNVEGSILDEINVINGVKVIGISSLPSLVSDHASFALSNNFINFISDFYCNEKKRIELNLEDEIIKSALLVHDGEILNGAFK